MQLHLDEIATKIAPRAHAILLLDQAGWHGAKALKVPNNISLLQLPPRAPELNGQEKYLAIHAAELVVEPNFQILRRYSRSLLLRWEHAHRSAVENHVHRQTRLGSRRSLNLRIGITGVQNIAAARGIKPRTAQEILAFMTITGDAVRLRHGHYGPPQEGAAAYTAPGKLILKALEV